MKHIKIILLVVFTFLFVDSTLADNIQFLLKNKKTYVSNALVNVYDENGLIYKGETNNYGKISIGLKPGSYRIEIFFDKTKFEKDIQITGFSSGFRRVYLD